MNIKTAAFLGGAEVSPESQIYKDATETARLLSTSGITTYLGGVGRSNYEGVDPLNNFDKEIIERDYFERTSRLLREGDAHIIFKGGEGTISEFGMTWAMSKIHEGENKPII